MALQCRKDICRAAAVVGYSWDPGEPGEPTLELFWSHTRERKQWLSNTWPWLIRSDGKADPLSLSEKAQNTHTCGKYEPFLCYLISFSPKYLMTLNILKGNFDTSGFNHQKPLHCSNTDDTHTGFGSILVHFSNKGRGELIRDIEDVDVIKSFSKQTWLPLALPVPAGVLGDLTS